jgi:hypothetical protein
MKKLRTAVLIVILSLLGLIGYRRYDRLPWIDIAAFVHSHRGSVDCGHVVEPDYWGAQTAVACALSAHENRHPFSVIFSVHDIEGTVDNAIIGNSRSDFVEDMYATGMFGRIMKHNCKIPGQLQLEPASIYHIPRLHCAAWPPTRVERDHLLW